MSGNFLFLHVNEWADFESADALPLSQGYILANLKQNGYSGHLLGDYKNRPLTPHQLRQHLTKKKPEAIGFSVYEENINRVRVWARLAKKFNPDIPIFFGGPQTTFMPAQGLEQMPEVDALCRGAGETVMLEVAQALDHGRPLTEVKGLCLRENGGFVETGACSGPADLDDLPSPYLNDALDSRNKSRIILLSSRGCASSCTFCYTPKACGKKVRYHSTERLIEEMKYLRHQGVNDFWFADPNFAHSRKRLELFLEAIIKEVPDATFWCQTRYNLVDKRLLALLKKAGAHTIAFGLESAHAPTLKRIKKGVDLKKMESAIKLSQDAGINVELFSLFGLPGESRLNAMSTLDFVRKNKVEVSGNSISQQLHVFFGTPLAEAPTKHGIRTLPITKPSYNSICRDFHTSAMSKEELRQMSLHWRLNRKDFSDDVQAGNNLFTIAGFITRNQKDLDCRPEADILLAQIYKHLDEPIAAAKCFLRLQKNFSADPEVAPLLAQPLTSYKSKRRAMAQTGCKIIFDCQGFYDGVELPETKCRFKIATLGNAMLLHDFEKGVEGMKAGSASQFEVLFPGDYGNKDLAGKKVSFQVYLHQVLEPVVLASFEEILHKPVKNMYRFDDLFSLKKHNENLYYMVLRDSILHSFTGNLNDMMALFNYYLKLGFFEKALDIAYSVPQEPSVMGHVGRVLLANERPEEALEFLQGAAGTSAEMENQRIKAHIKLERYKEAEKIALNPRLDTNLQSMHLRTTLASLRQRPVEEYLQRFETLLDSQAKMMAAKS